MLQMLKAVMQSSSICEKENLSRNIVGNQMDSGLNDAKQA